MDSRRYARTAAALVALAVLLVSAAPGAGQGVVKHPDTLTVVMNGDALSLDPAFAYDKTSNQIILWNVYETLLFFDGGHTDRFVPMLATEVPSKANGGISADGRTYTFKIRRGVRLHDGLVMTPEDVKYSLMRFALTDRFFGPSGLVLDPLIGLRGTRDDNGALLPDVWDRVDRAIQVRGDSVVITLHEPYTPFLNIMATWSMIVSRRYVVSRGGWDGRKETLARYNNPQRPNATELYERGAGTGPFRLESWDRSTATVTLVRNDRYWRTPAKLRRLVVRGIADTETRHQLLASGDADIVSLNPPDVARAVAQPGVRFVGGLPVLATAPALFMNFAIATDGNPYVGSGRLDGNGIPSDFFADVHVRRAFAHLFNRERWIRDAGQGFGRPANGPIPPGLLGYPEQGRWYELSREKATAELRQAFGGALWERGFRFTLLYNFGNVSNQIGAQMMKDAVEALNPRFRVEVASAPWPTYLGLLGTRRLPMFFIGWIADFADPDNFAFALMHSKGLMPFLQGYRNPQADELVEAASREADPKKREALYVKLQELARQDVPTLFIVHHVGYIIMRDWVRGWYYNPSFYSFGYYYTQWKALANGGAEAGR